MLSGRREKTVFTPGRLDEIIRKTLQSDMTEDRPEKQTALYAYLIFFLTFAVFNINFRYLPSGDTYPNELLPVSLLREGDLDFNEFVENPDRLPYCFRHVQGRVVSSYPVIPGILNLPVFFIASLFGVDLVGKKFALSMISSTLIASGSAVFMYLALLQVCRNRRNAVFFTLVYSFATTVWSVACRSLWQHGPSLLFINAALYLMLKKESRYFFLSGLFLGLAVFNRPPNLLIAFPLTIYVLFNRRKEFWRFFTCAALPAALLLWYSWAYWGNTSALGQVQGLKGFDGQFWKGLTGVLLSPGRGLFIFSPVFLLSFFYMAKTFFRKSMDPLFRYLSVSAVLMVLLYSKWGMWWGGWTFGYRLLTELAPVMILFLALFWEETISRLLPLKIAFEFLLVFSVFTHFLGAVCYPSGFNSSPDNIDRHPERLWSVRDSELSRCSLKLLKRLGVASESERLPEGGENADRVQ
jgi:hypothetical protein